MLRYRYDLVVRNNEGNLIAIIEVKNPRKLDPQFAHTLAQAALADTQLQQIPYLMVVSQDTGYLWRDVSPDKIDIQAASRFPMNAALARDAALYPGRRMSGDELVLRIQHWLTQLSLGQVSLGREPEKTLASQGFLAAIRDGIVTGDTYL